MEQLFKLKGDSKIYRVLKEREVVNGKLYSLIEEFKETKEEIEAKIKNIAATIARLEQNKVSLSALAKTMEAEKEIVK